MLHLVNIYGDLYAYNWYNLNISIMMDITELIKKYGEQIKILSIDITSMICARLTEKTCTIDNDNENCYIRIHDKLIDIEMKYSSNHRGEFFHTQEAIIHDLGVKVTYDEHAIAKSLQELYSGYYYDTNNTKYEK